MNAFRHTSYVVTEIQDLKDFHNFSIWNLYYGHTKKRKYNFGFWMMFGLIVSP